MYGKDIQQNKDFDRKIVRIVTICLKDHVSCPGYYCDTIDKRVVLECKCICHGSKQ
jgi:hypothetical protein